MLMLGSSCGFSVMEVLHCKVKVQTLGCPVNPVKVFAIVTECLGLHCCINSSLGTIVVTTRIEIGINNILVERLFLSYFSFFFFFFYFI